MGDLVKFLATIALLFAITATWSRCPPSHEPFRVYAPGATDYTSAVVQADPCPFADDAVVRAVAFAGAGGMPKPCPGAYAGAGLPDALYDDAGDAGTSAFCLEVPSVGSGGAVHGAVTTIMQQYAPYVVPLSAPTIGELLSRADAAALATKTTCAPLLLVAQASGYGGAAITSTRADGFAYAAEGGAKPSAAVVQGLLAIAPSVDARVALEGHLRGAYGTNSAVCNMRCAGDATKRCGCASGTTQGARCMSTRVDYAHYNTAPQNNATFWVAYRTRGN